MINEYWTIEYVHPNGTDESHVLQVTDDNEGILTTNGFFLHLNRTFSKNTLESTLKANGRPATADEIEAFRKAYDAE